MRSSRQGRFQLAILLMPAWLVVLGLMAWVSLTPGFGATAEYHIDKALHLCVYLVLGAMPALVLPRTSWSIGAGALLVLLGIALEMGQSAIPGRVGSTEDAIANVLGAGLGMALALITRERLKARF